MDVSRTIRTASSEVVGEFRLVRLLGEGGFGAVYEGIHQTTGQSYAVKRLPASADPERFEKEALYPARAARQSLHVVGIHSFFRADDGSFYLVTELIPHGDLAKFLVSHGPLSVQSALEIGIGISRGLAAIHKDGITHLDLKPINVLMDQKDGCWIPKIADFGLARSTASVHINQYGTVGYASPEHLDPRLARGNACDMFSLGMMLYELLTGSRAWEGTTITEYASWIARAVPPIPPSRRRQELQGRSDIDQLLASLLEFDAARRTLSAADVVERLSAALTATTARVPQPHGDTEHTPEPASPQDRRAPSSRGSSWRRLVPAVAIVVLFAAAAGAWSFWGGRTTSSGSAKGIEEFRAAKYREAFPLLLKEAEAGKADAESALGRMYAQGLGIERNAGEARRWLQRAADSDDDLARCALADLWRTSAFGTGSPEQARRLYSDVKSDACGHFGLGDMAVAAPDQAPGFDEGLKEMELAAQMGNAQAAKRLGEVHVAWTMGPLFQGAWQTLTGDERRSEIATLKAMKVTDWLANADVRRLRRVSLDFYEGTTLYELEIGAGGGKVGALDYLRRQNLVMLVNGQSSNIYGMNTTAPLRIDTAQRAAAYLRFFMAAVQGPRGIFRVVDEPEDLPWTSTAAAKNQASLVKAIRPWEMQPSGAGGWRAMGTVSYNAGLLLANFELRPNGMVDLEGRQQLADQLPVAIERFDDNGVRTTMAPVVPALRADR